MADEGGQAGVHQVICAVCATVYEDAPGARRIHRCPDCGSRLIRQEDGKLSAVATAAPPPKKNPDQRRVYTGEGLTAPLVVLGVVLLVVAAALVVASIEGMMDVLEGRGGLSPFLLVKVIGFLAAGAGGVFCIRVAIRQATPGQSGGTRRCIGCSYPLPWNHVGRCPECGKLQNPNDPRIGTCPGCRRTLRGFHGDACPECGADIRFVTDGNPPAEPQAD